MRYMVNFFKRLLGIESVEVAPGQAAESRPEPRQEDPEILRIRDANFSRAIGEFLHRPATQEELDAARAMVNGGDARKPLPQMAKEEMTGRVTRIAQQLGWTSEELAPNPNEYIPMQEPYAKMGERRQRAFEEALQEALGGEMTKTDVKIARAMFETDPDIGKEWETMAAEEVANYARSIAKRMLDRERAAAAK